MSRVHFIKAEEPTILALQNSKKVLDGALYVATDTGKMWLGTSASTLLQIKDDINTNTTYTLTKSGSTITLTGSDGSKTSVTDSDTNTWTALKGATADAAGTAGYAPAPAKGQQASFLRGDGTWATPTATVADDSVTLAKLGEDVGTVAVQSSTPSDTNVKLWIQI